MTMPITDHTEIEYLIRGCDPDELRVVLGNIMHEDWF